MTFKSNRRYATFEQDRSEFNEYCKEIEAANRIYKYECFEKTLDMAESLGWADDFPSNIEEGWNDKTTFYSEEDALEWIKGKGYRVVYPED